MPNVLVIHPNGTLIEKKSRVLVLAETGRGYWRDPAKTVFVLLGVTDDRPTSGYEYGGKKSYNHRASVECCDLNSRTVIRVPVESRDRTKIPVREAGGAKVMQLKPLTNRRTEGQHLSRRDRLWRPARTRHRRPQ